MIYSDSDLKRYLDGQFSAEQAVALEHALASDPALEDRLMALDPLGVTVHDAASSVGHDRPNPLPPVAAPKSRLVPAACAAALGALVIYGAGFYTPNRASNGWMDQVAVYQSLYSIDTISIVTPQPDAIAEQFAHINATLGQDLNVQGLQSATDLTLMRAQVLSFQGQPLAQIVFADTLGRPVALCLIASDDAITDIQPARHHNQHSAAFSLNGFQYLLIGAADSATATQLATQFRDAIAS